MRLSTLRDDSQFAFWSVILVLLAAAWFVVSQFGLRANPPLVGGIAALFGAAGAVVGLIGCLPGNRYRGVSLGAFIINAGVAIFLAPWVLWGL